MKVLSKNNKVLLADGQAVKWQSGGVEQVEWHQCPEAVRNYLENVTYDVSSASYVRLSFVLSSSAISTADTVNLTIYGS